MTYSKISMSDKASMTYDEFIRMFNSKPTAVGQRRGQFLMNTLYDVWPEEYRRISSIHHYDKINIDCFYKDELISNTLTHLGEVWKN